MRLMRTHTLRIIAFLLDYPRPETIAAAQDMRIALRQEGWLAAGTLAALDSFMQWAEERELMDLQEEYVALFDRTPSLSLHLFEHVHGDSRDRGQALVELDTLYRERGLENASEHTPDYLPMFLEYLSLLPVEQARESLDGAVDVIAVIGERLKKRGSPYAALFGALEEAAARRPDMKKLQSALKADAGMPLSADQMDSAWEEQFAFANMQQQEQGGGCPQAEEMLARMGLPATDKEKRA
jgi:nitrate reductase delta subunit